MQAPQIELIPSQPQACTDATVTIDVLIRITPPMPDVHFPRPPLNLALVLDRSGSMESANKMPLVRRAAAFVVEQLLANDRLSVTIYDHEIETIVPSTLVKDKAAIIAKIQHIRPRGSTDLHRGWLAGAQQVVEHRRDDALNRVLLMTDGLANVGVVAPPAIEAAAKSWADRGASTTTLGVGNDYNERLLEQMANASDGNYYFIESPVQLTDLFQTELQGLMATSGLKVSLGIEPVEGVKLVEVLNDLDTVETGRVKLPNFVIGMPQSVVVRLEIQPRGTAGPLCSFRLAWSDPKRPDRQSRRVTLDGRAPVNQAAWDASEVPDDVKHQVALLMSARAQREAALAFERGDLELGRDLVCRAASHIDHLSDVPTVWPAMEELNFTRKLVAEGDIPRARKRAHYAAARYQRSKPDPKKPEPPK